jgi:hypothetical protein
MSGMGPMNDRCREGEITKKRQRTAAIQNLAEGAACCPSRQRLGVRQPYAAFSPVQWQAEFVETATALRLVSSAASNLCNSDGSEILLRARQKFLATRCGFACCASEWRLLVLKSLKNDNDC